MENVVSVTAFLLLMISFFLWPLWHAIQGRTRKTRILSRIFFFEVGFSAVPVLFALYDQHIRHAEVGEVRAGTMSVLVMLWVLFLFADLIVIIFVGNKNEVDA